MKVENGQVETCESESETMANIRVANDCRCGLRLRPSMGRTVTEPSFHSRRRRRLLTRWRGASRPSARRGRGLCSRAPAPRASGGGVPRAEDDGVIGYAYASAHNERAAYRWSVSTAIYVSRDHHRRGAGRALYTTLFALLRALGYRQATAGITLPNPASVGLHAAFGFAPVGAVSSDRLQDGRVARRGVVPGRDTAGCRGTHGAAFGSRAR